MAAALKQAHAQQIAAFSQYIGTHGMPPLINLPKNCKTFVHKNGNLSFNDHVYAFTGPTSTGLDNWSKCTITLGTCTFTSSENVIFAACKAALFGDQETFSLVLDDPAMSPRQAKAMGRRVNNFDDDVWRENREWISDLVILIKCLQNESVMRELLGTRGRIVCEASRSDFVWGIGATAAQTDVALRPSAWRGANELGKSLMRVRQYLEAVAQHGPGSTDSLVDRVRTEMFFGWFAPPTD
ncbi:hypothetical protein HDU82_001303 [Entophlyctis luteolus]|nr:hypothetical protein HDU82_001303 [Entophlyctis luteolus]KAJ3394881.1 hypothetical protein HDU84_005816 [Entophlyctis sp. JEL0112]